MLFPCCYWSYFPLIQMKGSHSMQTSMKITCISPIVGTKFEFYICYKRYPDCLQGLNIYTLQVLYWYSNSQSFLLFLLEWVPLCQSLGKCGKGLFLMAVLITMLFILFIIDDLFNVNFIRPFRCKSISCVLFILFTAQGQS